MNRFEILVTGFTPFDGRDINASWIAASSAAGEGITRLEIPVVRGSPAILLDEFCRLSCPEIIISLGEGRPGWFDIETIALNKRMERPDNEGKLPEGAPILEGGPVSRQSSADSAFYQRMLWQSDFPARISTNAGQFLCEETLYKIEQLKESYPRIKQVLFCHVPPFGTDIHINGLMQQCDQPLLSRFIELLISAARKQSESNNS